MMVLVGMRKKILRDIHHLNNMLIVKQIKTNSVGKKYTSIGKLKIYLMKLLLNLI